MNYLQQKCILLVDDEPDLLEMVITILSDAGYRKLLSAMTALEALELFREKSPELVILDVMLPDLDGFSLFRKMRKITDTPTLFLSARGEASDRFTGLGLGADDYLVKPFLAQELILRVGAILRRSYKGEAPLIELRDCTVDLSRAQVCVRGIWQPLTAKEVSILKVLSRNAGRVVTIDSLCEAAWGEENFGYEHSLVTHIGRIREKIELNPSKPVSLITVRGLGYKLILKEM